MDAAGWLSQRLGPPAGLELDAPPGLCPLRPRPRRRQADPEARAAFKKTLPDGFLVEAALPLATAGGMGFCCAPAGAQAHPPTGMGPAGPGAAPLSRAVVRPGTGESEYGLLPSVSTEAFHLVLSSFARMRGAGEGRLVLDGLAHLQAGTGAGGCGALFSAALPA